MGKRWLLAGRVLWVLLACNALFLYATTGWIALGFLQNPSPRMQQGLAELGLSLPLYGIFFLVSITLLFLSFFVVALLIFLRRPDDGFALFVSIFLMNFGATLAYPEFVEFMQFYRTPPLWYAIPMQIASLASWPLLLPFLVLYPNGQFVPRWTRWVAAYGIVLTVSWAIFPLAFGDSSTLLGNVGVVSVLGLSCATFYAQLQRYRHYSSPVEQQQTKWFLFAMAVFVASTLVNFLPQLVQLNLGGTPETTIATEIVATVRTLAFAIIPIAIGISILRYRLWDIDVLIRKTLTYPIVVVVLGVVYFASVIVLQQAVVNIIGHESEIVTVLSTLVIAALFVPLRNRIQAWIDRRFYRKKYDAQVVLQKFSERVRDETDLDKLNAELMNVVQETMQPTSMSVWLKTGRGK